MDVRFGELILKDSVILIKGVAAQDGAHEIESCSSPLSIVLNSFDPVTFTTLFRDVMETSLRSNRAPSVK